MIIPIGYFLVLVTRAEKEKTLSALLRRPVLGVDEGHNAVVGVGGMFLLNIAAMRGEGCKELSSRISSVIVLDRSLRMEKFWNAVAEIIQSSDNKETAYDKIDELLECRKEEFFSGYSNDPEIEAKEIQSTFEEEVFYLQRDKDENICWLSTDERFEKIKMIFESGCFIFKRVDVFGDQGPALRRAFISANVKIDTLYLSNASEYCIFNGNRNHSQFLQFLSSVLCKETMNQNAKICFTIYRDCFRCYPLRLKTIELTTKIVEARMAKTGEREEKSVQHFISQVAVDSKVEICDLSLLIINLEQNFDQIFTILRRTQSALSKEELEGLLVCLKEGQTVCFNENNNCEGKEKMRTLKSYLSPQMLSFAERVFQLLSPHLTRFIRY